MTENENRLNDAAAYEARHYIDLLETTFAYSESLMRAAAGRLDLPEEAEILDIPSGLGHHACLLAETFPGSSVRASEFSPDHLDYARRLVRQKGLEDRISLAGEDMRKIDYPEDSFDLVWCCDGLWSGPAETGCIVPEPLSTLRAFRRMLKPGGTMAVLFWSSQTLLPGYPLIESALNAVPGGNMPMTPDSDPELHFLRAPAWLEATGFGDLETKTFAADIPAPSTAREQRAFLEHLSMHWGQAQEEVEPAVKEVYLNLINPRHKGFILGKPGYAGFLTYTMFTGRKEG